MSTAEYIGSLISDGFHSDIGTARIVIAVLFSVALGCYIFFVYRYKCKASFYLKDFNNVLAVLPVITASIVLAMQSSIVISLGMVGALSIVRFRNAVKSPLDLAFLFWSISVGIIIGAGIYEIAAVLSVVVTVLLLALDRIPIGKAPYLLIVHGEGMDYQVEIEPLIRKYARFYKVKSRTICEDTQDMIVEVRTDRENDLIQAVAGIEHVRNVNLLAHDGEVRL